VVPGFQTEPRFLFKSSLNYLGGRGVCSEPALFHFPQANETKLRWDETIFWLREDALKRALGTNPPTTTGQTA
jgi:hypothetical protein